MPKGSTSSRRSPGRHRRPRPPRSHAPVMVATVAITAAAAGGLHLTQAAGTGSGKAAARTAAALPALSAQSPLGTQDPQGDPQRVREAQRSSRGLVRVEAGPPVEAQALVRLATGVPQLLAAREVLAGQQAVRVAAAAALISVLRAATDSAGSKSGDAQGSTSGWALPVARYQLSAGFGASSRLWSRRHTGQDFAAPYGTSVRAVRSGVVISAGWDGAFGQKIVVRHEDGTTTWYCHLSSFVVTSGSVNSGEVIGRVGSTGNSTGNHLHFEVHPGGGDAVDPMPWLRRHGLQP